MAHVRAFALILSFIATVGAYPESIGLATEIKSIELLGPRRENSAAERVAFDLIERGCREAGLQVLESDFSAADSGHSFSRIVEARVAGRLPDCLAVLVPVNSHNPHSGDAGIALALELVRITGEKLRRGSIPPISLRFVFLGAQYPTESSADRGEQLGARTWISKIPSNVPFAALCLDVSAIPSGFVLRNAARGISSPLWYFNRLRDALAASGFDLALEANKLPIYRLGMAADYGHSAVFLESGVPAAELRGENGGSGAGAASAEVASRKFGLFFEALLEANSSGFANRWDRQYMIFQVGKSSATLAETPYIAILVALLSVAAALLLAFTTFRRHVFRMLAKRMPTALGRMFGVFGAVVAALAIQRAVTFLNSLVLGSTEAWQLAPVVFAAVSISGSFLIFLALASLLVSFKLLTPNPYFYEFAALAFLAIDIFVFASARASLALYFAWAFTAVCLSVWIRKPWSSIAAWLLMYLPLALVAASLVTSPEPEVFRHIISPGPLGLLAMAGLTFPFFIFTASPLFFYTPQGKAARQNSALIFGVLALVIDGSALAWAALGPASSAVAGRGPSEAVISELYSQDKGSFSATLSARRRLGSGQVLRDGRMLFYSASGDSTVFSGSDAMKRISSTATWASFLGRGTLHIVLRFIDPPDYLTLNASSDADLGLYDCGLPYSVSLDGKNAIIFVGANPGASVELDLTAKTGFQAMLSVRAEYDKALASWLWPAGGGISPGEVALEASIPLRGGAVQ